MGNYGKTPRFVNWIVINEIEWRINRWQCGSRHGGALRSRQNAYRYDVTSLPIRRSSLQFEVFCRVSPSWAFKFQRELCQLGVINRGRICVVLEQWTLDSALCELCVSLLAREVRRPVFCVIVVQELFWLCSCVCTFRTFIYIPVAGLRRVVSFWLWFKISNGDFVLRPSAETVVSKRVRKYRNSFGGMSLTRGRRRCRKSQAGDRWKIVTRFWNAWCMSNNEGVLRGWAAVLIVLSQIIRGRNGIDRALTRPPCLYGCFST